MLKQHNVENAEIPRPYDEAAPETLVQQHKAVVEAETAARLARAANNLKKDKVRKFNFKRETKKEEGISTLCVSLMIAMILKCETLQFKWDSE